MSACVSTGRALLMQQGRHVSPQPYLGDQLGHFIAVERIPRILSADVLHLCVALLLVG
jgi:hypothetical protein